MPEGVSDVTVNEDTYTCSFTCSFTFLFTRSLARPFTRSFARSLDSNSKTSPPISIVGGDNRDSDSSANTSTTESTRTTNPSDELSSRREKYGGDKSTNTLELSVVDETGTPMLPAKSR